MKKLKFSDVHFRICYLDGLGYSVIVIENDRERIYKVDTEFEYTDAINEAIERFCDKRKCTIEEFFKDLKCNQKVYSFGIKKLIR